jgi:phage-related protein
MSYTRTDIMHGSLKPIHWMGSSRIDLRSFPKAARHRAGEELRRVQMGRMPIDWKPMKSVGAGVAEIRVHTEIEHRVIYVAMFREAIYVLHAFEKRTGKTPQRDIDIARRRLGHIVRQRQA